MGCGCDGLSSVRQGGWCSLTWITWTVGGAKVRLAWVVTIWLRIYRVDSRLVQYMGTKIKGTAVKLRYIHPRVGWVAITKNRRGGARLCS